MTLPTDSDCGPLCGQAHANAGGIPSGDAHRRAQSEHRPGGKNKLYQETTAGAFFTLEHMSDFSLSGNNYDYVIRS